MKTIIAGSRSITDQSLVDQILDNFIAHPITEVLCGKASGVDLCGEDWAKRRGIPVTPYPADWKDIDVPGAVIRRNRFGVYNAAAGHLRNERMATDGEALILIWDGISSGSGDMLKRGNSNDLIVTQFVVNSTPINQNNKEIERS